MRTKIVAILLAFVVVMGGLSTGQNSVPPNPKIVGEPLIVEPGKQGGSLRLVVDAPPSYNPYVIDGDFSLLYASLLERNPITYEFEGAVAESFEWAPDGKAISFTLRNIKFSDGTPFTVDDVLFTINDVVLNSEITSDFLNDLRNDLMVLGQPAFKNAEKLDARRVRLNLNTPFSGAIFFLQRMRILPRHKLADKVKKLNPSAAPDAFVKAWGPDAKPDDFAILGPFKMKTLDSKQILLERNLYYWKVDKNKVQLPYLNSLELTIAHDVRQEELNRLKAGQLDYVTRHVDFVTFKSKDAQEFLSLVEKSGMKLAYQGMGPQSTLLSLNQDVADDALRAVFRDLRFRKAIAHLIDRDRLVKEGLLGYGVARDTFITPLSALYDKQATARFEFNLEKAKNLLDDMGLKDVNKDGVRELSNGKPLQIELLINQANEARVNSAKVLTVLFASAGIKLVTLALPGTEVGKRIVPGSTNYQALLISLIGTAASPVDHFTLFHSTGPNHFFKFSDAQGKDVPDFQKRVDELLIQISRETDDAKQKALASEFQKLVSENLPVIWLFSPGFYAATRTGLGNTGALTTHDAASQTVIFETFWRKE